MLKRRTLCAGGALGAMLAYPRAQAAPLAQPELIEVSRSPRFIWNAVALTKRGRIFVGMPRWPGFDGTPSVAEVMPDGSLSPYPGGDWNNGAHGRSAESAFVAVNTVHIFDDDSLWVVDQGSPYFGDTIPGAQKVVQIDTRSNKVTRVLRFDPDILPPGASLNDLRIYGQTAYFTDSGLGGIVIVDLETGQAIRRLSKTRFTMADPARPPIGEGGVIVRKPTGEVMEVASDPIEVSPKGKWLYFQPLAGPLWRVETRYLTDRSLSEERLAEKVESVFDTPPLVGTVIDDKGNLLLAEMGRPRITVLTPDGWTRTLIEDDRIWGSDALFIDYDRYLYIPVPQLTRMAFFQGPHGQSKQQLPFRIYKLKLPDWLGGRVSSA
jgi:sugar lactone lactonase YvrE